MAPRLVSFLCVGERLQGLGVPNAMAPRLVSFLCGGERLHGLWGTKCHGTQIGELFVCW